MGIDMASIDAPNGFEVYGPLLRANWYAVPTAPAVAVTPGCLVENNGTAYATKRGVLTGVAHEETGALATLVGIVLATEDHNGAHSTHIAASAAGDGVIAGYALVADHPDQLFIAQEDGVTSSLQVADIGQNVDAIGTGSSTTTYRSTMEIDSNTASTTNTLGLKILGIHPDDTISSAGAAGNHARFIVKINTTFFQQNLAAV